MTQKHTPGPWRMIGPRGKPARIIIKGRTQKINGDTDENGPRVVELKRHCSTDEANARLIAAAPELLEALEEYLDLDENPGKERQWSREARIGLARAAIVKAKGEA